MSENDPEGALISAGLTEYPAAQAAVTAFETAIQQIAEKAIREQLPQYKPAVGHTDPVDPWIGPLTLPTDGFSAHFGVGVLANAPETWGIRLGLRWSSVSADDSTRAVACLAVRVSAGYKKDKLFRALVGGATADVQIENSSSPPHEVDFTRALPPDATPEAIRDAFDLLVATFIRAVSKAGGLQRLVT
jgi:hypothetical protein